MYRIQQTYEAKTDVKKLAAYMIYSLKNKQAAIDFLDLYDQQIHKIAIFPFRYQSSANHNSKGLEGSSKLENYIAK